MNRAFPPFLGSGLSIVRTRVCALSLRFTSTQPPIQRYLSGRLAVGRDAHSFLYSARCAPYQHQQVRRVARISQRPSHSPRRQTRDALAIHAAADELLAPAASLFSLFHHLIPVFILSSEIPLTGRVFKESVKVAPSGSPPSADDAPLDLSPANILPHRARRKPQDLSRLSNRQQMLSNWRRLGFLSLHRESRLPLHRQCSRQAKQA